MPSRKVLNFLTLWNAISYILRLDIPLRHTPVLLPVNSRTPSASYGHVKYFIFGWAKRKITETTVILSPLNKSNDLLFSGLPSWLQLLEARRGSLGCLSWTKWAIGVMSSNLAVRSQARRKNKKRKRKKEQKRKNQRKSLKMTTKKKYLL